MSRGRDNEERLLQISERLRSAVTRLEGLQNGLSTPDAREALLFNLERAAWASIELANLWVFQLRIGMPRKEAESFDLLAGAGRLPIDHARRLKYAVEYRNLSCRDPRLLNWEHLEKGLGPDIELFRRWNELSQTEISAACKG